MNLIYYWTKISFEGLVEEIVLIHTLLTLDQAVEYMDRHRNLNYDDSSGSNIFNIIINQRTRMMSVEMWDTFNMSVDVFNSSYKETEIILLEVLN